jgi:hypothetical protein
MIHEVGDQSLKSDRVAEDRKDVEEDDALLKGKDTLSSMCSATTFLGKSAWVPRRLFRYATSPMVSIKRDEEGSSAKSLYIEIGRVQNNFLFTLRRFSHGISLITRAA